MTNYDNASGVIKSAYSDGEWWGAWAERRRLIEKLKEELLDFNNVGDAWHEGFAHGIEIAIAIIDGER